MDGHDRSTLSRRRLLASGAWVAGAAALSACGGGSSNSSSLSKSVKVPASLVDEAKKLKQKSVRVLSQKMYTPEADKSVATALQNFAKQTGTTLKNATVDPDAGNFVAKQDAAVRAKDVQDLAFVAASRFVPQLQQLGDLEDVSDVVAEMEQQYGPAAGIAANYLKIDGKWWGVPFYTIGSGWFVRKDWLTEKGIKVSDIVSYENARDIALEISDPSKNRYGWGITVNRGGDGNGAIGAVINAWGGSICADDGRKVIFNSPETIDAVTWLADIYQNKKYKKMLPPGVLSWTDTGNNEAWLAGVLGLTANQDSLYAQSKSTKSPIYGKTATLRGLTGPGTPAPLSFGDLTAFVIFKGAKNPDLAKLIPKYLAGGDALLDLAKDSGAGIVLPAYEKVWKSQSYYLHGDPIFKTSYDMLNAKVPVTLKTGLHFPQGPSAGVNAVNQSYVLTDMMGEILQKGTSVKQAVSNANKRIVQAFEQQGLKQ